VHAVIDARQRNIALLVSGCFFMENLDGTIVTTAAPKMATSLHVAPTAIALVITAYLLTLAVLIPLSGWLTQRFGTRPVFLAAIAVFTVASLACAASVNLGELVAMRVLQGIGGAMMVPVGRLVVLAKTEKQDIMRVISYIVWPGLVAPVIAPLAGGLITTYASWRWLFLINIPLGAIAFAVAWRLIERVPTTIPPPLDWLGVILNCVGLGGLTYTAHLVSETATPWPTVAAFGTVSLAFIAFAVWHLLRTDTPLVNLRILRVPTFRASCLGGFLFWVVVGATPFLLTLLFQSVFGWSPVKSGALVLFVFIGNIAIKPATTPLLNRYGFRRVLVGATASGAAMTILLGLLTASTPLVVIALIALLAGIARSIGLTGYATVGLSDISPDQLRDANVLMATNQQLSAGLAVAAATVALRAGAPLGRFLPGSQSPASAYTIAFVLLAIVALLATADALLLHPHAGSAVRTTIRKSAATPS
jgi:EmrB/QacA subfamily drug resistance transporter